MVRSQMFPRRVRVAFWECFAQGFTASQAAAMVGVSVPTATLWVRKAGGVNPRLSPVSSRLSFDEREQIMLEHLAGQGVRAIARKLGRSPSTISRELKNNLDGEGRYRALRGERRAQREARRPKGCKLEVNQRLRDHVQQQLEEGDSPEQIAHRLAVQFPDDAEMRVSHETIYKALYVQGRGGLRKELTTCLRTGRAVRKPQGRGTKDSRAGSRIPNLVSISERPAEVEDRAVPGHWEGDLIMGAANKSAIGTLVERTTGFVILLHLPDGHTAEQVQAAMVAKMSQLPEILRRTLTWDRGTEMTNHVQIAQALDLDIYFCDPYSPWQRGTSENTNGLLRQYFPKGADLSLFVADYLDFIATRLNNRPRKRHDWHTPAEVLDRLLSDPNPTVAFTA